MDKLVEQALIFLLKQLLTDKVVEQGKVALVVYLKSLAADSANKVDDYMVQVIAEALGVQLP